MQEKASSANVLSAVQIGALGRNNNKRTSDSVFRKEAHDYVDLREHKPRMPNSASVDAKKTTGRVSKIKNEFECNCVPLIDDNVGSSTTQTCGNFCANTNAKMQRTIVWNIMRNFYIASAASSSCASPDSENYFTGNNEKQDDFQLKKLLSERVGNAGDRKFLVNAKWWN